MGEPGFTRGPWIADCDLPGLALKAPKIRARGCTIAEVIPQATAEANANLIAAAPDLYTACLVLLERSRLTAAELAARVKLARAAIAKAEGRQP